MDPRERVNDLLEAIKAALDGRQSEIWTCEPGIVTDVTQLGGRVYVSVQPAIKVRQTNQDGSYTWIDKPVIPVVPVQFPAGGGYMLTFPIAVGDEGVLIFAHRCFDGWWQSGGAQLQMEMRMHNLTDGIFIPKIYSQPRVPSGGVSTTTARLTREDGTAYIELSGQACNMVFPDGVTITAPTVAVDGLITATGNVTAGEGTDDQVDLQQHKHGGVTTGGAQTDVPVPGS